jgi:dimeric dUTPase (all-alpha-NTP-PPase superfamily)|tara:strand:+ start:218 stop:634 length:417 start_codon:yes stop_codon:yes gene_type:complete
MTQPQRCKELPAVELPEGDMLSNLFNAQLEFQTTMAQPKEIATVLNNKTGAVKRMKQNLLALHAECSELLEWLPWKDWKTYSDSAPSDSAIAEAQYELIDIQHFVINIAIHLGMTPESFFDMFMRKQEENRDRQRRGY